MERCTHITRPQDLDFVRNGTYPEPMPCQQTM
jgi:hypothetical protein